jgi:Rod binding domain-containing protein
MTSLPPIDAALVPADVRKGGEEDVQLYTTALQFESTLTRRLAEALVPKTDEDSSNIYEQMLPDAFAQGITAAGGLGLAPQLYAALKEKQS